MEAISNKKVIKIKVCLNFRDRLIGFMFKKNKLNYGFCFPKCNCIHTFFCFQKLDIIMTDKNNNILYIYKEVKPNIIIYKKNVKNIYEFSTGLIEDFTRINFNS